MKSFVDCLVVLEEALYIIEGLGLSKGELEDILEVSHGMPMQNIEAPQSNRARVILEISPDLLDILIREQLGDLIIQHKVAQQSMYAIRIVCLQDNMLSQDHKDPKELNFVL